MSGEKEAQERGYERIEEIGELIRSTERRREAEPHSQDPESVPESKQPPIKDLEPPPAAEESKPIRKSRAWDRRLENRKYSYRLGKDLDDLIKEAVADYRAGDWHTTKSEVIRAWALAGRELWLEGDVEVPGRPVGGPDEKRKRPRGAK